MSLTDISLPMNSPPWNKSRQLTMRAEVGNPKNAYPTHSYGEPVEVAMAMEFGFTEAKYWLRVTMFVPEQGRFPTWTLKGLLNFRSP